MNARRWVLCSLAVVAAALGVADVRKDLEAVYARLNSAMLKKDVASVIGLCTKDFVYATPSGANLTRGQMEEQLKGQMRAIKKVVAVTIKIDKVTQKGAEVVARTTGVFEADIVLTPDAKKASRLKSTSVTDDTWVQVGGKWMLKKVKGVKETSTLDGKPFSSGM